MSNGMVVMGIVEIVKMLVSLVMQLARQANMTPEELDKMWYAEKAKFDAYDPATLPDAETPI